MTECRTALVTGGTSGLGLAMAAALAESGLKVAISGRSRERAVKTAEGLPGALGTEIDVRDTASVAAGVEEVWSEFGGIDLLVNNAGIGMRTVNPAFMTDPQGFWTIEPDGFRAVIDTNLTGYFLMAREVTPRMLAAGHGRIVNISMNHSTMTRRGFVPYGPSRAGAESLSRIMAADLLDSGVTVNMLLPGGATRTGMVPAERAASLPGLLEPEIMGPPIVWLASAEAGRVHDERIVAAEFPGWLRARQSALPERYRDITGTGSPGAGCPARRCRREGCRRRGRGRPPDGSRRRRRRRPGARGGPGARPAG